MEQPTITMQIGLHEAAVLSTALTSFVQTLNAGLAHVIPLEGEGTGRTLEAIGLKFTSILMLNDLLHAAGAPEELITAALRELSEGE